MSANNNLGTWEDAVKWLRSQPDKHNLVMGSYYDDPLIDAAERYWNSEEWQAVRKYFPKNSDIIALDVGAGRGIASYAMARDGFSVTALEPDPSDLVGSGAIRMLAKQSNLAIKVSEDVSERLPFADNSFDVIFARAVLHHTRDLKGACKEFFRVLKPSGRLVAIREHVISHQEDLDKFFEIHPLHCLYGGENAFLLTQYLSAFSEARFSIENVINPLDSPVNLAPYTERSFKAELAARIGNRLLGVTPILRGFLSLPGIWPIVRIVLKRFDHRPGRLYSFVLSKT